MLKLATRTATALALLFAAPAVSAQTADYRARLPQDEVIYFLLPDRFENGDTANDRGGLKGGPLVTGFDPTAKGFYHGGDLKGLTRRLDYIQSLGATALWVGPIFKNKPVQGGPGQQSAGYHGYWITDFTQVDPHPRRRAHRAVAAQRAADGRLRHAGARGDVEGGRLIARPARSPSSAPYGHEGNLHQCDGAG